MSLLEEVEKSRKKVVTDGYDMSIGELVNLYKDDELIIDPVFQRLFRWDDERKSRFVESILLGIPIPSVFVHQKEDGVWELVDGLQRLSTIFQLVGILKGERAAELGTLVLNGTKLLPGLDGRRWEPSVEGAEDGLGQALQVFIKRARLRVEILKSESDLDAKFELFQRLNTGGAALSAQEVRNSMAVSMNNTFYQWLVSISEYPAFLNTTNQTATKLDSQVGVELALRFLAFRNVEYKNGLDVHEYLDTALVSVARNSEFDFEEERLTFERTFDFLDSALGKNAFKRWNGANFGGMFLMSLFEVMAIGVSRNLDALGKMDEGARNNFLLERAKSLWQESTFTVNSGAGVRGTTRLAKLLPEAQALTAPTA